MLNVALSNSDSIIHMAIDFFGRVILNSKFGLQDLYGLSCCEQDNWRRPCVLPSGRMECVVSCRFVKLFVCLFPAHSQIFLVNLWYCRKFNSAFEIQSFHPTDYAVILSTHLLKVTNGEPYSRWPSIYRFTNAESFAHISRRLRQAFQP
jgi:hypothetical protein